MSRWIPLFLLLFMPFAPRASARPDDTKIDLAVLYAGVKDDPRTAEFVAFLSGTFARVDAIELATLSADTAKDADVVILDSPSPYGEGGKFAMPKAPALTLGFTKPTILMGAAGGAVLRPLNIKLHWL